MVDVQGNSVKKNGTEYFKIRVKGKLGNRWSSIHKDLTLSIEDNRDTCLTVPVADQAELFGFLRKVNDLGMTLLSVNPVKPETDEPGGKNK